MKKYKLTEEFRTIKSTIYSEIKLYRIQALRNIGKYVKIGDIGGYVQSEKNLSQEGDCWIFDDAYVMEDSIVMDNAVVRDNAKIEDYAVIEDDAVVRDSVIVRGYAHVKDNGDVRGNAKIEDYAIVAGNSGVNGDAVIWDHATISGFACVHNKVHVGGYAKVYGESKLWDNASVRDNAEVFGWSTICDNALICDDAVVNSSTIGGNAQICGKYDPQWETIYKGYYDEDRGPKHYSSSSRKLDNGYWPKTMPKGFSTSKLFKALDYKIYGEQYVKLKYGE